MRPLLLVPLRGIRHNSACRSISSTRVPRASQSFDPVGCFFSRRLIGREHEGSGVEFGIVYRAVPSYGKN